MKIVIGCVLMLGLVACGGPDDGGALVSPSPTESIAGADPNCPTDGEVTPDPRPASTAEIDVKSPAQGERVVGDSVEVEVDVSGACILAAASTRVRPDTGHVHIDMLRPGATDYENVTNLAGTAYTVEVPTPGLYTLKVGFYAADHGPFNPHVEQIVRFRVVAE